MNRLGNISESTTSYVYQGQFGYAQVTTDARAGHQKLSMDITIPMGGFLYTYVINESNVSSATSVYFDDFTVLHTRSAPTLQVVQTTDYYPFGLAMAAQSYQKQSALDNDYLYNGKELQDEHNLGWIDYGARMYMAEIGRWNSVDKYASVYEYYSPYSFCANNPIISTDYDGKLIIYVNGFRESAYKTYVAGKVVDPEQSDPPPHKEMSENLSSFDVFEYWGDFNKSWSFPDPIGKRFYVDGANDPLSSGVDRFNKGETEGRIVADKIKSGEIKLEDGETIKLIGHSMGAAHAMGMAKGLLDAGIDPSLIQVLLFAAHQPNQIQSLSGIFLLQAYRNGDKVSNKGNIAKATGSKNARIGNNSDYALMPDGNEDGRGNHGIETYSAEEFKKTHPLLYQYLIDKKIINPDGTVKN